MSQKINIQDLASLLAEKSIITKKEAENFIKQWLECVENGLIEDKRLKIKDLGTFKLNYLKDRESIDVATGERLVIPAHYKINFDVDNSLSETINEPFALFDTVNIAEDEKKSKTTQFDLFGGKDENIPVEDSANTEDSTDTEDEDVVEFEETVEDEIIENEIIKDETAKDEIVEDVKMKEKEIKKPEEKITAPVMTQKKVDKRHEIISSDDMEDNWSRKKKRKRRRRRIHINWKVVLIILVILFVVGIIKYINSIDEKDSYQRSRSSFKISNTTKHSEEEPEKSKDQVIAIPQDSLHSEEVAQEPDTITGTGAKNQDQQETKETMAPEETKKDVETPSETVKTKDTEIKQDQVAKTQAQPQVPVELAQTTTKTPEASTKTTVKTPETSTKTTTKTPEASTKTPDTSTKTATKTPETSIKTTTKTPETSTKAAQTSTQTSPKTTAQTAQTETQTQETSQAKTQPQGPTKQKKRKLADGEQLTSVAMEEYGNMIFWIYIYLENNKTISNPNAVPSGTEIVIPPASKYRINKNDSESIKRATDLQSTLF